MSVLQALPLLELQRKVPIDEEDACSCADAERNRLLDKLMVHDRMNAWDAKGFEVQCHKSYEVIEHLVRLYEYFRAMSDEQLKQKYVGCVFPEKGDLARSERLDTLKMVLVWEQLPVAELQRECVKREVPFEEGEINCAELVCGLKVDLRVKVCRSYYEAMNVPVDRLDSMHADLVAAQYERYDAMDPQQLRAVHD